MGNKHKPPQFFPMLLCDTVDGISKNALIDMVWQLASRAADSDSEIDAMNEIVECRDFVLDRRKEKRRVY